MNVTGLPRVSLTPMTAPVTAETRVSHSPQNRQGGAVGGRKPDTVDITATGSSMMELSQQFNLRFLMLQQDMQMENRKFTTLSNVMKTKHQTASSA